jgi:hypothetical protein
MPTVIRNNANNVEFDMSVNLKVTVSKGGFDVMYEDVGDGVPYVYVAFRSNSLVNNTIKLDWRDCSSPDATFTSAENLRDTLLGWNIAKMVVTESALPSGASTSANQINGTQASKFVDENGTPYGVRQVDNKPRVSAMPYLYDIAEGNISGHTSFAKLGYNADVGATEEDIITQGGVYPWIAVGGIALDVVSSDTNDTVAGSGIQKVRVSYLKADYTADSEIISMAGTNPVPLTDTHILRVNSIRATQVGANAVAAGNITVENVGGSTVYRQISQGFTRGRGLTYTVPLGKTLYLTSVSVSSGFTTAGKVVRWIGRAEVDDNDPTVKIPFFQPFFEIITQDASFHRDFEIPIRIPATADLKISAVSNGAGSFCNCALRGWLE